MLPDTQSLGIPQFYRSEASHPLSDEELEVINNLFPNSNKISKSEELIPLLKFLGLSKYLADPVFNRIQPNSNYLNKFELIKFYKNKIKNYKNSISNFFHLISTNSKFITKSDLKPFIWTLLDTHPGLQFLRDSPEFQERYAETVTIRIFFHIDRRRLGRISLSDLRQNKSPELVSAWRSLDDCEDINQIRNFFSYEHFYVLYCKFWDLDSNHDFLLDRDDLLKYDNHSWNPKGIDRVLSLYGRGGVLDYEGFVHFILNDEDKQSDQAIEYLFRIIDFNNDGILDKFEILNFYSEQVNRMECINSDPPSFRDIYCQFTDLLGGFTLSDLKQRRKQSSIFFSILLSLNKFIAYEQRDPFAQKQDQIQNPDLSDWDRFCLHEYVRLAMEAGGGESIGASNSPNSDRYMN